MSEAGRRRIRTYHEVDGGDRSDLLAQVTAQRDWVAARLASVRHVVAVMSGKDGVGKSVVTTGLAAALARGGRRVGVLDGDLHGPTAGRMLGAPTGRLEVGEDGVEPAVASSGVRVMSSDPPGLSAGEGHRRPGSQEAGQQQGSDGGARPLRRVSSQARARAGRASRLPGVTHHSSVPAFAFARSIRPPPRAAIVATSRQPESRSASIAPTNRGERHSIFPISSTIHASVAASRARAALTTVSSASTSTP